MGKCVITREAMASEYDGTKRKSAKYFAGTNNTVPTEIENGMFVKVDSIISGQREVFKVVAPANNTPIADLWVVTTPEVVADERKKNLDDFTNEADDIITIDKLVSGEIFALEGGLTGTAAAGYLVGLSNAGGVKAVVAAANTNLGTVIGDVLDITNSKVGIKVK